MIGRPGQVAAAAVCVLLLAACGPASPDESQTTGAPVVATTAPTASIATSSPPADSTETTETTEAPDAFVYEDEGQELAGEVVVQFWATLDRLSQDPEVPVQELAQVAQGQAVTQWVSNIQGRRERASMQTGDTEATVTDVVTIEEGQRYEVTACLDWSEVEFNGEKPDRGELGDRQQITYVVQTSAVGSGPYVSADPLEYGPCEG